MFLPYRRRPPSRLSWICVSSEPPQEASRTDLTSHDQQEVMLFVDQSIAGRTHISDLRVELWMLFHSLPTAASRLGSRPSVSRSTKS